MWVFINFFQFPNVIFKINSRWQLHFKISFCFLKKEATGTWETEAPACNLTYSDITRRKQSAAENAVSASASNQFVADTAKCKGFAQKRLCNSKDMKRLKTSLEQERTWQNVKKLLTILLEKRKSNNTLSNMVEVINIKLSILGSGGESLQCLPCVFTALHHRRAPRSQWASRINSQLKSLNKAANLKFFLKKNANK